mmetsp:Transcript_37100/g.103238  ORF Transcript_37100/g.103238 Transcript_37100/m.103238 type:complete len:131 (-) Transcript_37100:366-758(-)|eukprot:CAMPEP_0179113122 /NCGR_PEP_ID=MMETSP0796-20121207/52911_1 /TAXON_ID=73915 /ORGANISM="Pyrodinium bahamense, Strain pbaha01" /LENGTH=130 /DNA_ID=CAMNT_0020811311 /DNA_START=76 /DNA_END=468 /DNA_ORIENTATION=+
MPADRLLPGGELEPEELRWTLQELELEAELRAIELDIAVLDLRRDLSKQEQLVEEWQLSLRVDREALLPHEWTEEDHQEDREQRHGLRQAQDAVAAMRRQLEDLEARRSGPPHAARGGAVTPVAPIVQAA